MGHLYHFHVRPLIGYMRKPSDITWRFIRSLSSGEKLFFKRNFAANAGDKIYLRLFTAIAAQKEYDEAAILRKFSPALTKKNIAFQKHYLHKQITEAVLLYSRSQNQQPDIYTDIQLIRLYRNKGLVDEANIIWKKAVLKARKTESYAMLNLLKTEFEKMIMFSNMHTGYDDQHSVFKDNLIPYSDYAEMITLRDIYTETLLLKRKAHYDISEELRVSIHEHLKEVNKCTPYTESHSFWYGHYYRMNKATLLYLQNEISTSMELLNAVFTDWKKNDHFIRTHGEYYIELLYMINYAGILNGDFNYVSDVFHDPINENISDPVQRANFEVIKFLALNKIYNKTARYTDVSKLISFMKTSYRQWEPVVNADLNRTVNLSLGIACFVLGQYDDALNFTKRAITWFREGTREEHTSVAQILLLLIAYNMNKSRLFDNQYRSTYQYFYKRKNRHAFETALVQCLHRTFYMTDNKKKIEEYKKALKVFEQNEKDVVQQMSVSIFNYPGWLMSRVERIPYRSFVERKVKVSSLQPAQIST